MAEAIKVRTKLKAFAVIYSIESKSYFDLYEHHTVITVAYSRGEANDIFTKYAKAKKLYDKIIYINIEIIDEIKRVKHMINKDYYIKQNDLVNKLYEEFKNKKERNK